MPVPEYGVEDMEVNQLQLLLFGGTHSSEGITDI